MAKVDSASPSYPYSLKYGTRSVCRASGFVLNAVLASLPALSQVASVRFFDVWCSDPNSRFAGIVQPSIVDSEDGRI